MQRATGNTSSRRMLIHATFVLATLSMADAVRAADAPAATPAATKGSANVIEEVVVTAQRHEELADAPIAVTEFTAEQRNLIGAATLSQMIDLTPGITLTDFGLNIRGVGRGQTGTALGSANSVAAYVNGFYNFDPNVIGENTLIGGNVQFLRGPQGTRYGRDAIGGAANLISRQPTDTFLGEGLIGYGRYGWYTLGATVAGPLSDRYRFRLGAQHFRQPKPSQTNINPIEAGFEADNLYIEAQLDGNVTDELHFLLRSTTFSFTNHPGYTAPARYVPLPPATTPFQGALVPNAFFGYTTTPPSQPRVIDVDFQGVDKLKDNQVHILNADYNFGGVTLFYVGGYAQYVAQGNSDLDNSSRRSYQANGVPGVANGTTISTFQTGNYDNHNHYQSHELRLEGNDRSVFEWNLGLYYLITHYDETYWQALPDVAMMETPTVGAGGPAGTPNPSHAYYSQRNIQFESSKAIFGQATYHFNQQWATTVGLRYTEDDREAITDFHYAYYGPQIPNPIKVLDVTPAVHSANPHTVDSGITARLSLEYKPQDATLLYASAAQGYKGSSFSLGNFLPSPGGHENIADPEKLYTFELGIKQRVGSTFDGDVAVFYYDYNDLQILLNGQNDLGLPTVKYTNGQARMYGAELQANWRPTQNLNLNLTYTYLNAKYSDDLYATDTNTNPPAPAPPVFQNLNGKTLPRTPQNKLGLSGYYAFNFVPGSLYLGGSVVYTGETFSSPFNGELYKLDANTLANLSATWRVVDNHYDIVAAVSNLTDKIYPVAIGIGSAAFGNARTTFLGAARFYSLQTRIRF